MLVYFPSYVVQTLVEIIILLFFFFFGGFAQHPNYFLDSVLDQHGDV